MCKKVKNAKTSNTKIDKCMRKFIENLKHHLRTIEIVACCCGHKHKDYPMTIIVKRNIKLLNQTKYYDLVSGKEIPRTRNFYKRDKQGFYYIPEVLEQ